MSSISDELGMYYGLAVSLVCLGVVVHQGWNYFTGSFKDKMVLRLFVATILTLSIMSSCINIIKVHDSLLIDNPSDRISKRPNGTFIATFTDSVVLFFLVHCFFASRIFLLTKKWFVPIIALALSLSMLGLTAYAAFINSSDVDPFSLQYFQKKKLPISLFHGFTAVTDIIVSITLSFTLMKLKARVLKDSDGLPQMLNYLLVGLVTRGILLATVQICHMIMFLVKPDGVSFCCQHVWYWTSSMFSQHVRTFVKRYYVGVCELTVIILNSRSVYRERSDRGIVELTRLDFATVPDSQSDHC
ncbi:hypothetical protein BDQ17DRAFT_1375396 [Cyathus striatus]|nr:hypothetical protein BDQ17DRAFT_1375396 [Cyathus striatus]